MTSAPIAATMLGGITVNVSGPCFRRGDIVKVIFDEYKVDCVKVRSSVLRFIHMQHYSKSMLVFYFGTDDH